MPSHLRQSLYLLRVDSELRLNRYDSFVESFGVVLAGVRVTTRQLDPWGAVVQLAVKCTFAWLV